MEHRQVLKELRSFVEEEHEANFAKLYETWEKPLSLKLETGETQRLVSIKIEDKNHLLVTLSGNDSRFREGDMICLHSGNPKEESFIRQAVIEHENDREWLLRAEIDKSVIAEIAMEFYADIDAMDLKQFFDKSLDDVASTSNGQNIILPLLSQEMNANSIFTDNYDDAADLAEEAGLNDQQIHAVALGVASKYLACIQGPPGTGKTKVISLIAKLLVAEGQRVLLTSHTHMAINNALNKIANEEVPVAKIGHIGSVKGLDKFVSRFEYGSDWTTRPDSGYVIGATPFATCTSRLESFEFDTVIFDEASQVTVPLAVMAMRKAKRFVFVGDHKQLPPVVLSKSVLDKESYSVFSKLILWNRDVSVMLNQTYRMNKWISSWPSNQYYAGDLISTGPNAERKLKLANEPNRFSDILSPDNPFVFIKSPGLNAKTQNKKESELVVDLIITIKEAGVSLSDIGVVTPYRNHGKMIRTKLLNKLGIFKAEHLVTDTVERMQGQEREIIIISLCSTDRQFIQAVANFFFQPERLNVAITRPMVKLILIGPYLSSEFKVDVRNTDLNENIDAYRALVKSAFQGDLQGKYNG